MGTLETLKELFFLRVHARIDSRLVAWELDLIEEPQGLCVRGFTMFRQTDAFVRKSAESIFGPHKLRFELKVLSRDCPLRFAEIQIPAAGFYRAPRVRKMEMLTQGLYASVVRTFFERDGFTFAQHPDGYVGYVPSRMLRPCETERYLRWKNGPSALLRAPLAVNGFVLAPSTRLICEDGHVELVGGERIVADHHVLHQTNPADTRFARTLEQHAQAFARTPYLWGGKTHDGIDCSGFMQSLFAQEHVLLPRDANIQANVGEIVGYLPKLADLLAGDLVFFMNNDAGVFHVGMYVGQGRYLHSSLSKNIACSAFERDGENYIPRFGRTFAFARRVRLP